MGVDVRVIRGRVDNKLCVITGCIDNMIGVIRKRINNKLNVCHSDRPTLNDDLDRSKLPGPLLALDGVGSDRGGGGGGVCIDMGDSFFPVDELVLFI